MGGNRNCPEKNVLKVLNSWTNSSEPIEDESTADSSIHKYRYDSDYDDAFKNLLCPIELIAKKNHSEVLQYDLLKELDSYLNHLRKMSDDQDSSSVFVEAALVFQNVLVLYQKRADQLFQVIVKLIQKFQDCRMNRTENASEDAENVENNKKKKNEKKIKFYPSFDSIKGQIFGTLKMFDCKAINLSKIPTVPKIVLNANIKVENKYNQILPYIFIGNGEKRGKKYEYMVNYPLNCDLAVNEEFDCPTKKDKNCESPLKYQKNTDLFSVNVMEVDEIDSDDILPSIPEQVTSDSSIANEICVANAMKSNPPNILNASQLPPDIDNDNWATVLNNKETNYTNKPLIMKVPTNENIGLWLPTFKFRESRDDLKLKSDLSADPVFRRLVHKAYESQRLNTKKINKSKIREKKQFERYDEEMIGRLLDGEILRCEGISPLYSGDFDDNDSENSNEREQPLVMSKEDIELYKKDVVMHDQNQEQIMNEQLLMAKRVQIWHDNLRPILEEEEKRTVFDIHEYGTNILNSFESKGEKKSFKELFGGLQQEEVARYFLSTLIMINTNNLKIINSCDESDTEIKIKFLKKERHHEELQFFNGNEINQGPK